MVWDFQVVIAHEQPLPGSPKSRSPELGDHFLQAHTVAIAHALLLQRSGGEGFYTGSSSLHGCNF